MAEDRSPAYTLTAVAPRVIDLDVVRVLLVEDNDGDARLVEIMLGNVFSGRVELTRATTLAEALVCIDREPGGCILLDLGLPDAEGLEALERITARVPATPVVVLTGHDAADMGVRAVAAGAQDYLVKGNAVDETLGRAVRYAVVRKQAEDALVRSEQTLAEAQRIAQIGSWALDLETNSMEWSAELHRLLGRVPGRPLILEDLFHRSHPEDRKSGLKRVKRAIGARTAFNLDHRVILPEGSVRWLRSQGRFDRDRDGSSLCMRGTSQDITEQKAAEDALAHLALHDPLTGLPNRLLLLDRLALALKRLGRNHSAVALLFVDVDRFKVINDSLGHPTGDQLLLALARRLEGTLRLGDTLARFGGDEFVVLCEGLSGEVEALGMADRIAQAMTVPLTWGGGELVVTLSTGIALATSPLVSPESLVRDADAAMYRAKEDGRARAAVFAESMRTKAIGRLDIEVSLRQAIALGELEVHYQPIVGFPGRRVVGAEALVRWRHPDRGLVGPEHFIPIAEETGLIVPLGAWVLTEAAAQARRWQQRLGPVSLTMAVNLSGCQVAQPDLVEVVAQALESSGLAPHCLELEITETVLMKDAAGAVKILESLKGLGVHISIDDFGTGYSSLSYLKRFPIDVLKIDRAFIDGLGIDSEDSAIVKAIMSLSEALNLGTVAEGVETSLQAERLVDLGCERAQGYFLGKACPVDVFDRLLERSG